ncbi:hypothetical protein DMP08_05970 [Paraeggerthella hongkongensis]|uniref:Uncharacterized protein n=1 Tax=Paraeggerthella hongkongensis TaxID=230658 RepID=A0A3N0BBK7_9ACTN|nr:hypothetical protein DMP08_05970 [Paraeggerthella hongkongensis]
MGRAKVRMSQSAARAVLKSGGVRSDLLSRAEAIASAACARTSSDGMSLDPFMAKADVGPVAAKARAFAATPHGARASNKNAVLLKSLDAGR